MPLQLCNMLRSKRFVAIFGFLIMLVSNVGAVSAACIEYESTNSEHETAGRAYSQTTTEGETCYGTWCFGGTEVTTWYAAGSDENLGTSGSVTTTLHEESEGVFVAGVCPGPDLTVPVITITGDNPMTVYQYAVFTDPGATAEDHIDGDITADIAVTGFVFTNEINTYELTYTVSDSAGNQASASRIVNVVAVPACQEFIDTVANHEAASRAHSVTETTGQTCFGSFCYGGTTTTTWYAEGSDENLGTNSSVTITLRTSENGYVAGNCPVVPVVDFSADKSHIYKGSSVVLSWTVSNADYAGISQPGQLRSIATDENGTVSNSWAVTPTVSTTYQLKAVSADGIVVKKSFYIKVSEKLEAVLTVSKNSIFKGESVDLTWITANGIRAELYPEFGEVELNGSMIMTPEETVYYSMMVWPEEGPYSIGFLGPGVEVKPLPVIEFAVSNNSIIKGESTHLTWSVKDADSVDIQPDEVELISIQPLSAGADVGVSGDLVVSPTETTTYTLTVKFSESLVITKTVNIEVIQLLAVQLEASAIQGYAPLTVQLSPITSTNNAINRYYWDFEGNGGTVDGGLGIDGSNGFDRVESLLRRGTMLDYDSTGRDFEFTYDQPGTYSPRIRVWDANGEQRFATIQIVVQNQLPQITADADVTNGEIPLTVNFVITTSDDDIADYKWDFDGDGVDDETTTSKNIQHVYTEIGTYQAKVTVTDTFGGSITVALPHINIRAVPVGDPSVQLTGMPVTGVVPLNVSFSGAATIPSGSEITSWEWDYDGDGVYEAGTNSVSYTYNSAGTYYPRVKMTTAAGKTAEDVVQVVVSPKFDFAVLDKSFDPDAAGGSARISATVYGESDITIVIENRGGSEVRTILDWTTLTQETYEYTWDGKNELGELLEPGDYYAVLKYKVQDVIHEIDLRDTTGGDLFYPRDPDWTGGCVRGISPCGTVDVPAHLPLEPFNNKPWVYTVDIPHVADLTCYMSIYTTNDIVATFFQKRAVSDGVHKIIWNGEGTDSRLLPHANSNYLITVMGYTLADNVIYLKYGAALTASSVNPIIFDPSRRVGPTGNKTQLIFDLSKDSDLVFYVNDMATGKEVFRKIVSDVIAGAGAVVEWDGRGNHGSFVAPGDYIMSVKAVVDGYESLPAKGVVKVKY